MGSVRSSSGCVRFVSVTVLVLVLLTPAVLVLPLASADGVPAVPRNRFEDETPEVVFRSIFESRQLAMVELVNDTHQRISLFLSVHSLDPGENLSVVVPLRTLPLDVVGEPMGEVEFRKEYNIKQAEREVVHQDPTEAWGRVGHYTRGMCEFALGSLIWSMPGEYVRQEYLVAEGEWGFFGFFGGMILAGEEGMDPLVQHYEFDGFSVDVLAVRSGPTLDDYLTARGYAIPESSVFDPYTDHYVAVVEAETRPPIDADAFQAILENIPGLVPYLQAAVEADPTRTASELEDLKSGLRSKYHNDWMRSLEDDVYELVDAVFGEATFEGEVLSIDLPLDGDRMFFPLGTSGGWPNAIGDIDILFKVPADKDLRIDDTQDAFFDGHHWYLFSMEDGNPDFDLESRVLPGDDDHRRERERAGFVYDNAGAISVGLSIAFLLAMFSIVALLVARRRGEGASVLRDRRFWTFLLLALVLSLPGALLLQLLRDPVPLDELRKRFEANSVVALYLVAVALLAIIGVAS